MVDIHVSNYLTPPPYTFSRCYTTRLSLKAGKTFWCLCDAGLTLPVVFVVAGPGQCDHHGAVQRQHHGTETPAATSALIRETLQLSRQVEGRETEARERNWQDRRNSESRIEAEQQERNFSLYHCEMHIKMRNHEHPRRIQQWSVKQKGFHQHQ